MRVVEGDRRLHVVLDRPDVRNAINEAMVADLHLVCSELERHPRVLIISGGPKVFASGADLHELLERSPDQGRAGINRRLFDRIAQLPLPTIAAVAGLAIGGGAELAYACDFRIGTPGTRFLQPEVRLGVLPASGACSRLPALIGPARAKELLLAGGEMDADTALRAGLLNEVVEPPALLAGAHQWADRILAGGELALQLTKACVDAPPGAHPALDDTSQAILFGSGEKDHRISALIARGRQPRP